MTVLAEMIGGAAIPGNPLAIKMFKLYGFVTLGQALTYAQDLKLAHYIKLPPRTVFAAQTLATVIAAFAQLGVLDYQILNIADFCDVNNTER